MGALSLRLPESLHRKLGERGLRWIDLTRAVADCFRAVADDFECGRVNDFFFGENRPLHGLVLDQLVGSTAV